jgi:uncharacterized membrane protein YadS
MSAAEVGTEADGSVDDALLEDGSRLWTPAFFGGLAAVLVGGVVARYLAVHVPAWTAETSWSGIGAAIEFPIYAIALGLLLNVVLNAAGLRDKLAGGFRTEFFIKTGLVILGAGIVLSVIVSAAGPAILQALLLISSVFAFTWWLGGVVGLDQKLRALLASAVSICGVSAAIAAAGAVQAKREQLAYAASLVIVFALPSIFLFPWIAGLLGLSPAVTGAWLGGNIDTTAAVTAAGSIAGEQPLAIATVVKLTQNALIGIVAVALTAWFAFKVEPASADTTKPMGRTVAPVPEVRARIRDRFPCGDTRAPERVPRECRPDQLGREDAPGLLPDPGVRQHRLGVQGQGPARRRLEAGGRVRCRDGVQRPGRAAARQPVVPGVRRLNRTTKADAVRSGPSGPDRSACRSGNVRPAS